MFADALRTPTNEEIATVSDRFEADLAASDSGVGIGATIESPSLFAAGRAGPTAYELKYLLTEKQAHDVQARIAKHLSLDPFADPALGNAYLTTSVYTDTPAFDVLRRTKLLGARKYRVRRYGHTGPIFAERKTKRGDEVRKRRSPVPDGHLAPLSEASPCEGWPGEWFRRQVMARQLRPVCRVSYERVAFMGPSEVGIIRVTLDRNLRGAEANGWNPTPVDGTLLLPGQVICEFKFRVAMPTMFKVIVANLGLAPATVSKYRTFMGSVRPEDRGGVDA